MIKWYDFAKWLLERIDNFPKSQRFIFGQRLADHAVEVLEMLIDATYSPSPQELDLLKAANRKKLRYYDGSCDWLMTEGIHAAIREGLADVEARRHRTAEVMEDPGKEHGST